MTYKGATISITHTHPAIVIVHHRGNLGLVGDCYENWNIDLLLYIPAVA